MTISVPVEFSYLLWHRRRGIGAIMVIAGILGIVAALLWPIKYRATATFIPEQTASSSRLSGTGLGSLAGQLGLSLSADPMQSGRFYADVLLSRRVIEQVLHAKYPTAPAGAPPRDSANLLTILGIKGRDSLDRVENGVRKIRGMASADADLRTNIVSVTVLAKDPLLSAAIANRFVQVVNEFNTRTRQTQAGRRRSFIDEQADSAERELRLAEDRLKTFYQQNRSWAQSPELEYRRGQLQRQVEIEQEVYLTLRRGLETARIDEVNDVPLISVIDNAVPSHDRNPRRRTLVIAAFLLGAVASLIYAYMWWYLESNRQGRVSSPS